MSATARPRFDVDFHFDTTLDVECDYSPYIPATRWQPAEGGYTVRAVYFRGIDVTSALEPMELDAITRKVNDFAQDQEAA